MVQHIRIQILFQTLKGQIQIKMENKNKEMLKEFQTLKGQIQI